MKNKLMSSILICIICISCLVLFGCTGGLVIPNRFHPNEEYFDEVIAWGPLQFYIDSGPDENGVAYVSDFFESYDNFYRYEDICDLGILSDEDLKIFKKNEFYLSTFIFSLYFGVKDGEDVVYMDFPLKKWYVELDKLSYYFKSNLNFKFEDILVKMEEITGIEMTKEIVDPHILYRTLERYDEETGETKHFDIVSGIYFNILKNSEYTFDFVYVDDNLIEYHVYR